MIVHAVICLELIMSFHKRNTQCFVFVWCDFMSLASVHLNERLECQYVFEYLRHSCITAVIYTAMPFICPRFKKELPEVSASKQHTHIYNH